MGAVAMPDFDDPWAVPEPEPEAEEPLPEEEAAPLPPQVPDWILMDQAPVANCRGLELVDDSVGPLAEVLKRSDTIVVLDLAHNSITDKGVRVLVDAILANPNTILSKLDLSKNQIGPAANDALGELLAKNNTIEELDLSWNDLGDVEYDRQLARDAREKGEKPPLFSSMDSLAKGLYANTKVAKLSLSRVQLTDGGATALSKALPKNTSLRSLDLSVNQIGPSGVNDLAEALQYIDKTSGTCNRTLSELDLNYNHVGPDGAAAIAELLTSDAGLEKVALRFNNIGTEGAISMSDSIKKNSHVSSVSLGANDLGLLGENYVNLAIDMQEEQRGASNAIDTDIQRSPRRVLPFEDDSPKPRAEIGSLIAASPSRYSTRSNSTMSMSRLHKARAYKALFANSGEQSLFNAPN